MSKYNNRKVSRGGKVFDSAKEAQRYAELRLLEKAGKISDLRTQVRYELIPAQYESFERYSKAGKRLKDGKRCVEKAVTYVADFVYCQDGKEIVEDTKGYKKGTAYDVFVIKRKLMLWVRGIRVREL